MFGDGHLQPLHAAADVHHDDDVLGGRGGLDVPDGHRRPTLTRQKKKTGRQASEFGPTQTFSSQT